MLRASSAGLVRAFPSTTRAYRLWKAPVLKRVARPSFPPEITHDSPLPAPPAGQQAPPGLQPSPPPLLWSDSVAEGSAPHPPKISVSNPGPSQTRIGIASLRRSRQRSPPIGNGHKQPHLRVHSRKPHPARTPGPRPPVARVVAGKHSQTFLRRQSHRGGERCELPADPPLHDRVVRLIRDIRYFRANLQKAWGSFVELTRLQFEDLQVAASLPHIPYQLLKEFGFHVASRRSRAITPQDFPRLLLVCQRLWDSKARLPIQLWTSLLLFAGKGYRTGSRKEYDKAAGIFQDMVAGQRPGTHTERQNHVHHSLQTEGESVQPDLHVLNTLLSIAARSLSKTAIQHTVALFKESGLKPDYITHMSLLVYYTRAKQIKGVRLTIRKMAEQNLTMRTDALNAIIYAYIYNDRNQVAFDAFRLVRNNIAPEDNQATIEKLRKRLWRDESLRVPRDIKPDVTTYTLVIQAAAYQGDFNTTFAVLHTLLSLDNRMPPSTAPAFRAVFLGFSKYAIGSSDIETLLSDSRWNLHNLQILYKLFMQLPTTAVPTRSTIFWIMVAFDKASDKDKPLMRGVWIELKQRYERHNPGLFMQVRLRRLEQMLFSPEET